MKYAIFSDIHGNYEALKVIINDAKKRGINNLICIGDVIGIGPKSNECIDLIRENDVELILGNHELYLIYNNDVNNLEPYVIEHNKFIHNCISDDNKNFLKTCKLYKEINNIIFSHFFIINDEKIPYLSLDSVLDKSYRKYLDKKYNYYFLGHEHSGFIDQHLENKIYFLGTSGLVKTEDTFYYIITINDDINVEKISIKYDKNKLIDDILLCDYPQRKEISLKYFNYDIK